MQIEELVIKEKSRGSLKDYIEVIKPRETLLLVFIGVITALLAANGSIAVDRFFLILAAILIASAGANGLTNYLDRNLDGRMERTKKRVLPSRRIYPAEKALVFCAALTVIGLVMAWYLHPLAFLADLIGTAAAIIYRKRVTCVFPQGMIAGCAPILMGWLAVKPVLDWEVLLICVLIALWLPSHIWSIMMAHQKDYQSAGLKFFPVNSNMKTISRILMAFSIVLLIASLGLYFVGNLGLIYLITSLILGIAIIYASFRLMLSGASQDAWKLYKMSAFPYLGILFLGLAVDIFLRI